MTSFRLILSGLLPFLSLVALANPGTVTPECEEQLRLAKKENRAQLVVSFEGLLGQELFGSPVKRQLILPTIKKTAPVAYISHGCTTGMANALEVGCSTQVGQAHACLKKFKSTFKDRLKVTVVGHSFGGSYGVMNFIRLAGKSGVQIQDVLTLDARTHHDDTATFGETAPSPAMYRYSRPAHVQNMTNIYQCTGLRGYLVKGAKNINACAGWNHMTIPLHPEAKKIVMVSLTPKKK